MVEVANDDDDEREQGLDEALDVDVGNQDNDRVYCDQTNAPDVHIEHFGGRAGEILDRVEPGECGTWTSYHGYSARLARCRDINSNQWAPFTSQVDWEVARWAKLRGPGSTAFTELLAIPSVSHYWQHVMNK